GSNTVPPSPPVVPGSVVAPAGAPVGPREVDGGAERPVWPLDAPPVDPEPPVERERPEEAGAPVVADDDGLPAGRPEAISDEPEAAVVPVVPPGRRRCLKVAGPRIPLTPVGSTRPLAVTGVLSATVEDAEAEPDRASMTTPAMARSIATMEARTWISFWRRGATRISQRRRASSAPSLVRPADGRSCPMLRFRRTRRGRRGTNARK